MENKNGEKKNRKKTEYRAEIDDPRQNEPGH